MMRTYRVVWTIELDANSSEDAAAEALVIQRDPNSTATIFSVGLADDPDADYEDIDAGALL